MTYMYQNIRSCQAKLYPLMIAHGTHIIQCRIVITKCSNLVTHDLTVCTVQKQETIILCRYPAVVRLSSIMVSFLLFCAKLLGSFCWLCSFVPSLPRRVQARHTYRLQISVVGGRQVDIWVSENSKRKSSIRIGLFVSNGNENVRVQDEQKRHIENNCDGTYLNGRWNIRVGKKQKKKAM